MTPIKLPRPEPMNRSMVKTTHGKNGVPELTAFSDCSPALHRAVSDDPRLFEARIKDQKMQHDYDGEPLMVLGQCIGCGTTISRLVSEEARLRLTETPEQTEIRHARR